MLERERGLHWFAPDRSERFAPPLARNSREAHIIAPQRPFVPPLRLCKAISLPRSFWMLNNGTRLCGSEMPRPWTRDALAGSASSSNLTNSSSRVSRPQVSLSPPHPSEQRALPETRKPGTGRDAHCNSVTVPHSDYLYYSRTFCWHLRFFLVS